MRPRSTSAPTTLPMIAAVGVLMPLLELELELGLGVLVGVDVPKPDEKGLEIPYL